MGIETHKKLYSNPSSVSVALDKYRFSDEKTMPALIERRKMTRATYQALKRHILRERVKRKQEQEADLELERQRKEIERRKMLEKENKNTLQQTKDEIVRLNKSLEELKKEKSKLFAQLKRVLETENTKKEIEKKHDTQHYSLGQSGPANPAVQFLSGTGHMGRPVMYKPALHPVMPTQVSSSVHDVNPGQGKGPRSPSPTPNPSRVPNVFQFGSDFNPKMYNRPSSQKSSSVNSSLHSVTQPTTIYGGGAPSYGPGTQFPQFLHATHASQGHGQHTASKHLAEAYSGGRMGQQLPQSSSSSIVSDDKAHRGGQLSSSRHNPSKGSIMTGYPVHSNTAGHQAQGPLPLLHNLPRHPYQHDGRPYF